MVKSSVQATASLGVARKATGGFEKKKYFDFFGQCSSFLIPVKWVFVKFWKVVPVFAHGKRVEIQLLIFLKFL